MKEVPECRKIEDKKEMARNKVVADPYKRVGT